MSNHSLIIKSGFLRAPLANGIGRYIGQLQRITIKFCKHSGSSRGLRDFLENDLLDFAKENPGVVVYVKPRRHRTPVLVAEYLNGERHWLHVKDFPKEDIIKWIELLRTQSKDGSQLRLRKMFHTEFPTIQGAWTPYTFRNPMWNVTKFPDSTIGNLVPREQTATQKLLEIFKAQKAQKVAQLEGKNLSS
ncbi:39S ribosomal protein L43, mitochondrial [Fopius arisanus]|uniref:Large ribosomal subunit protein mL43 n=1 Tax=Fopius arisanus TaxID=64838 RepID=A0A9R1TDR3_9HYME|nr:PREDICTED: 39S ribosomal protein L43, mitochondrial [Fopius arisanus]